MSEPYGPPTAPPPGGPPATARPGLPWDREKTGNALVDTAKGLVTAPGTAYAEMREKGDYLAPVLFAVIFATFGTVIGQIWNLAFGGAMGTWLIDMVPPEMRAAMAEALQPSVGAVVLNIILAPVIWLVLLFVFAVILHLFLLLLGGTRESTAGFEGTVRVVGYSFVANLAQVIPFLGGFWFIWAMVLCVIGFTRVHRTSSGKAAGAVLLPVVLCCVCLVVIGFFAGAAIFSALSGAGQ